MSLHYFGLNIDNVIYVNIKDNINVLVVLIMLDIYSMKDNMNVHMILVPFDIVGYFSGLSE